jgi:glycosyltransferase involved in cell wall biosynthesis
VRVLFFADNFPPETNAPANRTHEHCARWVEAGNRVTVITCAPNFPSGVVHEGYRNGLWQWEVVDGIDVLRVWSFISANEGFFARVVDYVSYMVSAAIASCFVARPDVIVATSPQFFTLGAGWFAAKVRRRPWVLELRDIWPESIKAVGAMRQSFVINWLERLELFFYRSADRIVAVAGSFRSILAARGIDPAKVDVVTNGVDLDRFTRTDGAAERARIGLSDKLVVGYVGTHGMAHALETALEAADLAQRDAELADVHFLFVGDGARKKALVEWAASHGLANVTFLPSTDRDGVVRIYGVLDAAIVHLRRSELFDNVIPSKIFECMALGVPVLMGVEGEARRIVIEGGAGIAFEAENANDLLRAIGSIRDHHLRRDLSAGGVATASQYSRPVLAGRMLRILEEVADRERY